MRIRAIALHTFASFLRNRVIIVVLALCVCVVLLMMAPLLAMKAMTTAANEAQMRATVLGLVSGIMFFVSGAGSLLAIWAAADAVASEMKAGTILAVMARPVKRWEYLLGKYLGVQMLLGVYVLLMFGLSLLLAGLGGERIGTTLWALIVYPMVRYAVYSALAMLLVTFLHPLVTFAIGVVIATMALILSPGAEAGTRIHEILRTACYALLPSTPLLSETRFYTLTQASLKQIGWLGHLTTLAYGLDYAFVCLLLAMWAFRHRSLTRD